MLKEVYNKKILALAADIPHLGRLDAPDASASVHSRLCGSKISVDIKVDRGRISEFAHDVKACALGQASSSIVARHVIGASASEMRQVRTQMLAMLTDNGAPPGGRWADLAVLEPVRDFKARHASTMLAFDAVCQALDQIEQAQPKQEQHS